VLGWFADSFRFAWALLYWNTRKSWFRFRRGRSPCPCQAVSDSGRAYETMCEACWGWDKAERFKRVCPLLVRTPDGLRCSVNTADVRPFWGITIRYYGGTLLGIYAALVITVFGFLRTIGYPVSIVHVALPPLWHRVGEARGWFFLSRAQSAFAAGKTNDGLLYLASAYDVDPSNYDVGLALAKAYQLTQPGRSDEIFAELLRDHPTNRNTTAQNWFRSLLARGNFDATASLAISEVLHDPARADAWMRAALFSTRQSGDEAPLQQLLTNHTSAGVRWHKLVQTELLVRKHDRAARAAIVNPWPSTSPRLAAVYRVETLASLGDPQGALDLLEQLRLPARIDDEAYLTLRLDCLARAKAEQTLRTEFEHELLGPAINQPRLKLMCAQLIRHPDQNLFEALCTKVVREAMPLTDQTAGGWFSMLCTAGAVGDQAQLHALTLRLRQASETPFTALIIVESFFNGGTADKRATSFLPFLPVPLEVTYALIERYPGSSTASAANAPSR
jgi:hypothetical protein